MDVVSACADSADSCSFVAWKDLQVPAGKVSVQGKCMLQWCEAQLSCPDFASLRCLHAQLLAC